MVKRLNLAMRSPARDLDKLSFAPAENSTEGNFFTYEVFDGLAYSAAPAVVSFTVTAVNDAPVLDTGTIYSLPEIGEDIASADNEGALVSDILGPGAVSDVDVGSAPSSIAVTAVDNTRGLWQYQLSGGAWVNFTAERGEVNLGDQARLLDGATRLRFVPDANESGGASFSFRAWDETEGAVGGVIDPYRPGGVSALSAEEDSATLEVTPVNDAPAPGSDLHIDALEDTDYVFTLSDFPFTDAENDALSSVTFTSVPAAGSLIVTSGGSETTLTAGAVVSRAAIEAGELIFRPAPDEFGASYTSFQLSIADQEDSSDPATMTVSVTDGNDAPTAVFWSGAPGAVAEDAAATARVGQLAGTDPDAGDVLRFEWVANDNFIVSPLGEVRVAADAELDFETKPVETLRVRVIDSEGLSYEQDIAISITDVEESAPTLITSKMKAAPLASVVVTEANLKAIDAQEGPADLVYTITSLNSDGGTFFIDLDNDGVFDEGEALSAENPDSERGGHLRLHPCGCSGRQGEIHPQ